MEINKTKFLKKYWYVLALVGVGIFLYQRGVLSKDTVESFKTWIDRNIVLGKGKGYLDF